MARGRNLGGALDAAQALDDVIGQHQLDAGGREAAQAVGQRVGQRTLEADAGAARRVLAERLDGHARDVTLEDDHVEQRPQVLHPVGVAEVGDEHRALPRQHDDPVGARVAGQVAHAHEVRDEQRVDTVEGGDGAIEAIAPLRHAPAPLAARRAPRGSRRGPAR